jgi:hypothetical protein
MILLGLIAFQLCYQLPTENVDGSPVSELSYLTVYYGNIQAGQWDRTQTIEPLPGCTNIRASRGFWFAAMTATDAEGDESALSNWVRKEENRLAGPSGGRLSGPSNGRLITE